tara:strand:- start:1120 stop:1470 length:351 start_codon:yes stop_codon:yes gene_type:complete
MTKTPDLKTIKFMTSYSGEVIELEVERAMYANGQNAILLYEEGEPYMTATVAVDPAVASYPIDESQDVVIKNYSENEGILEALVEGGIIEKPHATIEINFVTLYVAKFSELFLEKG